MALGTSSDRLISLRGIGKRYGTVDVLRDIDIDLDAGECLGLVGENGAGKSTLLGIVSGKIPQTWGTIVMLSLIHI